MRLLVLPKLYCLLIAHLNSWKERQYFSSLSPCFGFFMCPCRRTHYTTLDKPGAQNIAACENQSKQCELSEHWKSIKMLFLKKITGDDAKKIKRLTRIQVLTSDFTSYKIRYWSLRKRK